MKTMQTRLIVQSVMTMVVTTNIEEQARLLLLTLKQYTYNVKDLNI